MIKTMMHLLIYCILQTTNTKSVNGAFFEDEDKDTEDFNDSDDASENLQILESFLHDVYLSEQRKIIFGSGCESKSFQTENLRFTACSIEFADLLVKKFTCLRDVFVNDEDERTTFLSELEISIDTAIKTVLDAYKQTGKAYFDLVNNDERALEDAKKQYEEEEAAQLLQMEDLKNKQCITREEMDMYKREYEIIKKGHFYACEVTGVDVTDEIKTKIAVIDEFFCSETKIIEANPLIENFATEESTGEEVEQEITKL